MAHKEVEKLLKLVEEQTGYGVTVNHAVRGTPTPMGQSEPGRGDSNSDTHALPADGRCRQMDTLVSGWRRPAKTACSENRGIPVILPHRACMPARWHTRCKSRRLEHGT